MCPLLHLLTILVANLCRQHDGPVGFQRSSVVAHLSVQLCTSSVEIFKCVSRVFIFIVDPKGEFQSNLCRHHVGPVGFAGSSFGAHLSVQLCPSSVEIFNWL